MKIWLIVFCSLFCIGCYQKVDHTDVAKAKLFCEDRGGIKYIKEYYSSNTMIACLNGESAWDYDIELPNPYNPHNQQMNQTESKDDR